MPEQVAARVARPAAAREHLRGATSAADVVAAGGVRDVSGVGAQASCLFSVLLTALLGLSSLMLLDPETHWHVAVGRWIWTTRAVPWTDPFSHTFAGAPWIAKEWLAQLLFYQAHALAGWRGVVVLFAATLALAFTLLFAFLRRHLRAVTALLVTLGAVLVVLTTPIALNARPQVFAFLLLVAWTHVLLRAVDEGAGPPWRALALMVLWANLHGTFTFGLLLGALLAAGAVLAAAPAARVRLAGRWGAFLAASFVAACVSPYGHRAMLVTATLAGAGEALPYIREWQPIDPSSVGGVVSMAGLAAAALLLLRRAREDVLRLAVVALLGYMMVRHLRFVPFFALATPLVLARPLARWRGEAVAPSPAVSWRAGLSWPLAALLAVLPLTAVFRIDPRPGAMTTPHAALAAARARGLGGGPVYNDYNFGGYLVAEGVRTFVDGRTDQLFLGGFITTLYRSLAAADHQGFANLLDRYHVTWALVGARSPSAGHLDALPGWRRVHVDDVALVYARR
jgi:hypothetical protein